MAQDRTFIVLIALATLAFGWVLWPLFGAIFWAVALVIVLDPTARRLMAHMAPHRNLMALLMVLGFVLLIMLPTMLIVAIVVTEATNLITAVQSGQIDLHQMFVSMLTLLPDWLKSALDQLGLGDLTSVQTAVAGLVNGWVGSSAPVVLNVGQNAASLFVSVGVMLYLMFFLFRDGDAILTRLKTAIPVEAAMMDDLLHTFTVVVRATVRGDILIALLQGCLGGIGFWILGIPAAILWTVLMAFLSLFPVFGAAIVWGPVALYLLANGLILKGVALLIFGAVVISMIDNLARPWLVGQETRMPDYVVLVSTIGGITTFGMQGFITGPVVAAMFIAVWTTFLARR